MSLLLCVTSFVVLLRGRAAGDDRTLPDVARAKNQALRAPERVEIVAPKSERPMIQTRVVNESARALQFSTI
jgi:hypothetical protein